MCSVWVPRIHINEDTLGSANKNSLDEILRVGMGLIKKGNAHLEFKGIQRNTVFKCGSLFQNFLVFNKEGKKLSQLLFNFLLFFEVFFNISKIIP